MSSLRNRSNKPKPVVAEAVETQEIVEDQFEGSDVEDEIEQDSFTSDAEENSEDEAANLPAATIAPSVNIAEKAEAKEPNVRVKTNQDLRTYIGNSWYNFKQGEEQNVPASVKAKLREAGLLQAL